MTRKLLEKWQKILSKITALVLCLIIFFVVQVITWFQLNGQFFSPWFKNNVFILCLMGVPISWLYIEATRMGFIAFDGLIWPGRLLGFPISYILIIATEYIVAGFDGLLWPGRLVGFGSGMIVMAILTWYMLGEGINLKTLTSLILATGLVCVQVFWRV